MFIKLLIPAALAGLLFSSQSAFAEETAAQPEQGDVAVVVSEETAAQPEPGEVAAVVSVQAVDPDQAQEAAVPADADMTSAAPETVTDEQVSADKSEGMAMQPGMMGPGKPGCRMGKGGMKGMMSGGMGKGCKADCAGITRKQYRELMGRLDVLDARMVKIDAMLEHLLKQ